MSTDRFSLAGKIALVNGGSRGIGESIAHGLAEQGARVIVSSRSVESCQKVADAIVANGGEAVALQCDAGNGDDITALFAAIDEQFGRLDILVNNGAVSPYFGPATGTPEAAFDMMMNINVKGPFLMCCAALKRMVPQGSGSIVNISSITATSPGEMITVYAMGKAAVLNMTKGLARENAKTGVRINAIQPGLIETAMTEDINQNEKIHNALMKQIPQARMAQPDEIVGGVLYLVSDTATFTTGSSLIIDGGMIA